MEHCVVLPDGVVHIRVTGPVIRPLIVILEKFTGETDVTDRRIKPDIKHFIAVTLLVQFLNFSAFFFDPFVYSFYRYIESPVYITGDTAVLKLIYSIHNLFLA